MNRLTQTTRTFPAIFGSLALVYSLIGHAQQAEAQEPTHADVVVYGGTPGGVTAAIAAAREGASVVLLEQIRHVGGLSTSGLNRDEGEHMDRSTFGGCIEFSVKDFGLTRIGIFGRGGWPSSVPISASSQQRLRAAGSISRTPSIQ